MNLVDKLKELIADKTVHINRLAKAYHLQTDIEFDIALLRLDFRFSADSEIEFEIFESAINEYYDKIRRLDSLIIQALADIEMISFEISNL
jgi:hypothetical protein